MTNVALKYGLIGGLISIALTLVMSVTGLSDPSKGWTGNIVAGLISIVIAVLVLRAAMIFHRDSNQNGVISYGTCIGLGVFTALIMGLISGIFNYINMNFIDTDMMDQVLAATENMMERIGADEATIEAAMEKAKSRMTPVRMVIQSIISSGIFGLIISLILGAVVKKEETFA